MSPSQWKLLCRFMLWVVRHMNPQSAGETPDTVKLSADLHRTICYLPTEIIINGKTHNVTAKTLSYENVLSLTGDYLGKSLLDAPLHTVAYYAKADPPQPVLNGSLVPGQHVSIVEGMVFTATVTR